MTEVVLDIKQWGNNLGVRLPLAIVREAHLKAHQSVRLPDTTPIFLSCLCGSEPLPPGFARFLVFLSCLCGSEHNVKPQHK